MEPLRSFAPCHPGLIEDENGVSTWGDFGCDFVEVKLHGRSSNGCQSESKHRPCAQHLDAISRHNSAERSVRDDVRQRRTMDCVAEPHQTA